MTMPKKSRRTVTVRGHGYIGDSGSLIRLVVELGENKYVSGWFKSKHWDEAASEGLKVHKVSFPPRDVKTVITKILDNGGQFPQRIELFDWQLVEVS